MSYENQDLKEYKEWQQSQKSWRNKISSSLTLWHLLAIVALGFFLNYLWQDENNRTFVIIMGIILVFIILFLGKEKKEREIIPEPVIKIMCAELISRKVGYFKDFPIGAQPRILPECRLRWNISDVSGQAVPFRWEVSFRIIEPNGNSKDYLAFFEPYKGFCTGLLSQPTGYTGNESPDIKLVDRQFTLIEKEDLGPTENK